MRTSTLAAWPLLAGLIFGAAPLAHAEPSAVDVSLQAENAANKAPQPAPALEDLPWLRRITVDLVGRIPTHAEILEFQGLPADQRRSAVIDRLIADPRFNDRWTVFFADLLRIRTGEEGGGAYLAFLHQSLENKLPYDQMCRQLISANGRANVVPEVGFVLGHAADPMALAGATSQTFLGIRIACAQCHDHPFDVWKREQFHGLAAYYGTTRRVERRFKMNLLGVYTMDVEQTSVLWPPEGVGPADQRKPLKPAFPFQLDAEDAPHVADLLALREAKQKQVTVTAAKQEESSLDDLLDAADKTVQKQTGNTPDVDEVKSEAKRDARSLEMSDAARSRRRSELADLITSPRNTQFSRALVNRVWAELLGRGFVEPVDDFSSHNPASHPQALDLLAKDFIAHGYDFRSLIQAIVSTEAYGRGRLPDLNDADRTVAERAFVSAPVRRMTSEVLYDSIVLAGHLFDVKHEEGKNLKTEWLLTQIEKKDDGSTTSKGVAPNSLAGKPDGRAMTAMKGQATSGGEGMKGAPGDAPKGKRYDLESALELDFNAVLKQAQSEKNEEPDVEAMEMVSKEQLEAEEELRQMRRQYATYVDRYTRTIVDDNPKFTSAMRMASPADPSHFLRVFGQPARETLGQFRDSSATMRQALMMLNGRLTHEAARVGELEPVYPLVAGKKADLPKAVELVYVELFTRQPSADEVSEGVALLKDAESPKEGLADLRWVLFNSHEFRFLP